MNYIKCRFIMQIHAHFASVSSRDVWVEREFDLPFVPFVGLTVTLGQWSAQIDSILFDADLNLFKCYCGEDKQLYGSFDGDREKELERIVSEEYEAVGWKRR